MKKVYYLSLISTLLTLMTNFSYSAGVSGTFLKIGVGARGVGMGSAYTAVSNDVTGVLWNPGGMSQIVRPELAVLHSQWLADTTYDYLGFAHPTKIGNFGTSIIYLSQGSMEQRNANRELTGTFTASDLAMVMSYSKTLSVGNSVGVNLKFVQQKIEVEQATAVAIDLGLLHRTPVKNLNLGLSIQNIGTPVKFLSESYSLPIICSVGLGYNVMNLLTLASDIKYQPIEQKLGFGAGIEYRIMNMFALRTGYLVKALSMINNNDDTVGSKIATTNNTSDNFDTGFTVGFGFNIFKYQLDYSYVPYSDIGNIHRVSLIVGF